MTELAIKMKTGTRPNDPKKRAWWWTIEVDGTRSIDHRDTGWAIAKENSYNTALLRLRAIRSEEVAER